MEDLNTICAWCDQNFEHLDKCRICFKCMRWSHVNCLEWKCGCICVKGSPEQKENNRLKKDIQDLKKEVDTLKNKNTRLQRRISKYGMEIIQQKDHINHLIKNQK